MLSPLLALVCVSVMRFDSRRAKLCFLRGLLVMFVAVLFFAYLRDRRIIKYKQISNIHLLAVSFVSGLAFCAMSWLEALRGNGAGGQGTPASTGDGLFPLAFALVGLAYIATLLFYGLPTIVVMPFHFVGMDDTYFSSYFLSRMTGFLLAFLLLGLLFLAVYRILKPYPKRAHALLFTVLFLLRSFMAFVSIVGIINSYYRKRFKLPAGLRTKLPQLMQAEYAVLFVALALLAALALSSVIYNVRIHAEYGNPAEHRRLKATARNGRRWGCFLLFLFVSLWLDLTVVKGLANRIVELSPSEEFQLEGNRIFIPLAQVSDGHLHRFTWNNGKGKDVRFIIVQKKGTNFGIGFDACEICGNVGYYERKNEVICNRCDVVMNKSTIGLKGGCNPIPLASSIEDGGIVILTDDLDKEAKRF